MEQPPAGWISQRSLSLAAGTGLILATQAMVTGPGLVALSVTLALLLAGAALYAGYRLGVSRALPVQTAEDLLTGFLPPDALRTALERSLALPENEGTLIHCELTGAPTIAATQGLKAEEHILREATARLGGLLPSTALAARAGRVSFLIYLPGPADAVAVAGLARSMTASLAAGFMWEGVKLACACHSGVAFCHKDGTTPDELLRNAELALAAAREQDTPSYGFFDPQSAAAMLRRRDVQRAVAAAHASASLRLAYQPIHHMRTGELSGFEALMRMEDPELGSIPPSEFIPAAEQTGLIAAIGDWAIDEACRTAALWPPHLIVAVNLSPVQFTSGTILQTIRDALERHGLPAYRLEIEITEGTLMKDSEIVLGQLRVLRDMGVGVALDDFGTGYSSLGYLWKFPFSKIKIDRSFVAALEQSASAKGILRSIVKLGHGLGMTVTAEGIETRTQLASLRELGCDMAQGYLLGRPAGPDELAAIVIRKFAADLARRCRPPKVAAGRGR
jgi:EAL domain-containing protein (putative c-di-GMP-specific phosphodiesterase class I)/GGDEF domain-containing protein